MNHHHKVAVFGAGSWGTSFSVVLAGLRAAGANQDQAASGLLAVTVVMGLVGIWLSLRERMPVGVAWSTPGAALLISAGVPPGGWPAAIGAFAVAGALTVATGLWRPLGVLVAAIPTPLASAMLAGVLGLGLVPFGDLAHRMTNVLGVEIPEGVVGDAVRSELLSDYGIEIGTSFGPLHGRVWRIGTMGYNARRDAVLSTLAALEAVLRRQGVGVPGGGGTEAALES